MSFKDYRRRWRAKQKQRRQELLNKELAGFENAHAGLIEQLSEAGHDRKSLESIEQPTEGTEHAVVGVRARSVAEATSTAIRQLGLPPNEVEIKVVDEGKPRVAGLGGTQAVVCARPKA